MHTLVSKAGFVPRRTATDMVGPVMQVLMRQLAVAASDNVVLQLDQPQVQPVGQTPPTALGDIGAADGIADDDARAGDSMPTPVLRYGELESARLQQQQQQWEQRLQRQIFEGEHWSPVRRGGRMNFQDDSGDDMVLGQPAMRPAMQAWSSSSQDSPPPESLPDLDDGFMLPPPAVDIDDPLIGVFLPPAGMPPHTGGTGPLFAALAAGLSAGGEWHRSPVQASDADSTPDMPWTAPHARRGEEPPLSPPLRRLLEAADAEPLPPPAHPLIPALPPLPDVPLVSAPSSGPAPAAAPERAESAEVAEGSRVEEEAEGRLAWALFKHWSAEAAASRLRRHSDAAAEAAKAVLEVNAAVLGLVPAPSKRLASTAHTTAAQMAATRPADVRMPLGCCQAVRVGRRRVAVQRVPRQTTVGTGGRRWPPCGTTGGGACRR